MSENREAEELSRRLGLLAEKVTLDGIKYAIVEGDLMIPMDELFTYALERLARSETPPDDRQGLVGMRNKNGRIIRWAKGLILTYSVLRASFTTQAEYERVVAEMAQETSEWEATCDVKFEHLAMLDDGAVAEESALFTVQRVEITGSLIARAFFPNDPPEERQVILASAFFAPTLRFDRVGVLRHELGHVLGFRHEHIRSEAPPDCHGESTGGTVDLTQYDPQSVMHYFCAAGVGDETLAITVLDREGAQRVYGPPDPLDHLFEYHHK